MEQVERLKEIEKNITENPVCLYMKGSKLMPQCGFSAKVAHILDSIGIEYKDFDVLQDPLLRQDIKDFSNWPTLPQLFVNKEFIGGCDIVCELFESGELQKLLGVTA